jgi:hypothetical protein
MIKAQRWMKENGHKDYGLLTTHDDFKILVAYSGFKKKLSNQKFYKTRVESKAVSETASMTSATVSYSVKSGSSALSVSDTTFNMPMKACEQALPTLEYLEENILENNEEKEAWTRWKDLIS